MKKYIAFLFALLFVCSGSFAQIPIEPPLDPGPIKPIPDPIPRQIFAFDPDNITVPANGETVNLTLTYPLSDRSGKKVAVSGPIRISNYLLSDPQVLSVTNNGAAFCITFASNTSGAAISGTISISFIYATTNGNNNRSLLASGSVTLTYTQSTNKRPPVAFPVGGVIECDTTRSYQIGEQPPMITSQSPGMIYIGEPNVYSWERKTGSNTFWLTMAGKNEETCMPDIMGAQAVSYRRKINDAYSNTITLRPAEKSEPEQPDTGELNLGDNNYIHTRTYIAENGAAHYDQVNYYNGLGYLEQMVDCKPIDQLNDLVLCVEYDGNLRKNKEWLPVPLSNNTGAYNSAALLKKSISNYYHDTTPYSEMQYESFVSDRITKTYRPGEAYRRPKGDKFTQCNYGLNDANQVMKFRASGDDIEFIGYYPAKILSVTSSINEDGVESRQFTDSEGRILLSQVLLDNDSADTYSIYDKSGRLAFVISPEGSAILKSSAPPCAVGDEVIRQYCYYYRYDGYGNLIEKRLPGRDSEIMFYDSTRRLTRYRDGNGNLSRNTDDAVTAEEKPYLWINYTYDEYDRITDQTTTVTSAKKPVDHNPKLLAQYRYGGALYADDNADGAKKPFVIPKSLNFYPVDGIAVSSDIGRSNVGLKIYEKLAVIDSAFSNGVPSYVERAFHYDDKGRLIQTNELNAIGGISRYTTAYDFMGNVLARHESHGDINDTTSVVRGEYFVIYPSRDAERSIGTYLDPEERFFISDRRAQPMYYIGTRDGGDYYYIPVDCKSMLYEAVRCDPMYEITNKFPEFIDSIDLIEGVYLLIHPDRGTGTSPGILADPDHKILLNANQGQQQYYITSANGADYYSIPVKCRDIVEKIIMEEGGYNERTHKYEIVHALPNEETYVEGEYFVIYPELCDTWFFFEDEDPEHFFLNDDFSAHSIYYLTSHEGADYYRIPVLYKDIAYTYATVYKRFDAYKISTSCPNISGDAILSGQITGKETNPQTYPVSDLARPLRYAAAGVGDIRTPDELLTRYTYDSRGRLLSETTTLNDSAPVVVEYRYDQLGRLTATTCGEGENTIAETFAYNIQGWLTRKQATLGTGRQLLDLELRYYDPRQPGTTPSYTGNMSEWAWQHDAAADKNTYAFTYDRFARLTDTKQYVNGSPSDLFVEKGLSYDRNGNIRTMKRTGNGLLESDFVYSYSGNQLTSLDDETSARTYHYAYDANGNMTEDGANGLEITYNYLNLAQKVERDGALLANYSYLSDGTKLRATDAQGSGLTYIGSFVYQKYEDEYVLESAAFNGGRFIATSAGNEPHYFVTDHLGSTRVVVNAGGQIQENSDYYPFGLRWETGQLTDNRYRYNGKEEQEFVNVPYVDYGARMYDPQVGRWFNVDPLAEKYTGISPFVFCANNPIEFIDPDGKDWYLNNQTGTLYFNADQNDRTVTYKDQTYTRIGDNAMMGDMGDVQESYYNYDSAQSFASERGYSITPSEQLINLTTSKGSYSSGKRSITVESGTRTIINQKYSIISADEQMEVSRSYTLEFDAGQTWYEVLMGGQHKNHTYVNQYKPARKKPGKGLFQQVLTIGAAIELGLHDNTRTKIYRSWSAYDKATNGKGPLMKYY